MPRASKTSSPECGYPFRGKTCTKRGAHFCEPRASRAVAFIETVCVHTKSVWARKPFVLEDWQRDDIIRPLFGQVVWSEQWQLYVRRYTVGWVELGRGNGKSELAAAIILLLEVGDDEESAELYGGAKDTKQAGKVGEVVVRMAQLSEHLRDRLHYNKHSRRLIDERTNSYYEVITADALGELGHNPYGAVIDEVLAQAGPDFWQAIRTAQGKRPWSLLLGFTTAGNDPSGFAAKEHEEMARIAEDPERAPHVFVYMRNTPVDADPWDEKNWYHANPALGKFLSIDTLREEAQEARNDPTKENAFRQFRLNQWVQQVTRYIPLHIWDENVGEVTPSPEWLTGKLKGQKCWAGLDLSAKLDMTAWCLLFEDWAWWRFWLPEAAVPALDQATGGQVSAWARDGWVTLTDGEVIDYDRVYADIEEDTKRFAIATCTYDKWSGEPVRQEIEKRTGLEMVESDTTYTRMTQPMKELSSLIQSRKLKHGGNPVARWHADSLEAKSPRDDPDRIRPVKPDRNKSGKRIDGMAALLLAIDGRLRAPVQKSRKLVSF